MEASAGALDWKMHAAQRARDGQVRCSETFSHKTILNCESEYVHQMIRAATAFVITLTLEATTHSKLNCIIIRARLNTKNTSILFETEERRQGGTTKIAPIFENKTTDSQMSVL